MKHLSDESCLLGSCNEGYRCDCFGFELCEITTCSKYASSAGSIPSDSIPFACHLKPNAATCTTVSSILDTTTAAQYAEADASTSDEDAADAADDSTDHVRLALAEKQLVRETLKDLEPFSDDIADDDLDEIEQHADTVNVEAERAASLQLQALKFYNTASMKKRHARRARRRARRMQNEADKEKAELNKERKRHNTQSGNKSGNKSTTACPLCEKLKKRIEMLESGRKTFATKTGDLARQARSARRSGQTRSREAKEAAARARASASACVKKARAVINALRRAASGSR